MKKLLQTTLLLALGLAVTAAVAADKETDAKKKKPFQAVCPVQGQAALESQFVDYRGKKIYFCCPGCPEEFNANPKQYAAKAHHQLLQTGQIVQVACPLSGHELNPEVSVKVKGVSVGLCCENCQAKLDKAGEAKALSLVFISLEKGFTLQTACPLSGKKIDPQFSLKHKGKNVYFCCENCPAAFKDNPEKYTAKLPQFAEQEKKKKEK